MITQWLAADENISLLADAGDFRVDILATETGSGRKIIIENQLEDTNHDHRGKLITYAAGKSADIIIWLVKHAREEHRAAVEWLNNHTDDKIGFFLCEIKLYRIGDSAPAVKFEVIERPNDWTKVLRTSEVVGETSQQRLEYWTAFQDYAFQNKTFAKIFRRRKSTMDNWFDFSIGSSACLFRIWQVRQRNELDAGIYIHNDKDLFRKLHNNKGAIESEIGEKFDWRELPDKKASRIIVTRKIFLSRRFHS